MQEKTIIMYNGSKVVVTKEVAEFLEQERKRENAEARSDRRHKDFTDLEAAEQSNPNIVFSDPILNAVIREETQARLKEMINFLDADSRRLIEMHYYEECSLTTTAEFFGITKQALSKRHAKLPQKMRELKGRSLKAKCGGYSGGNKPYGYYVIDGMLMLDPK